MQFLKGASLAIAIGLWLILAPRSVIWFYGDFLEVAWRKWLLAEFRLLALSWSCSSLLLPHWSSSKLSG